MGHGRVMSCRTEVHKRKAPNQNDAVHGSCDHHHNGVCTSKFLRRRSPYVRSNALVAATRIARGAVDVIAPPSLVVPGTLDAQWTGASRSPFLRSYVSGNKPCSLPCLQTPLSTSAHAALFTSGSPGTLWVFNRSLSRTQSRLIVAVIPPAHNRFLLPSLARPVEVLATHQTFLLLTPLTDQPTSQLHLGTSCLDPVRLSPLLQSRLVSALAAVGHCSGSKYSSYSAADHVRALRPCPARLRPSSADVPFGTNPT